MENERDEARAFKFIVQRQRTVTKRLTTRRHSSSPDRGRRQASPSSGQSVAAHEAGAAVLDPAEALADRRLDPGLHGVGLVPGHPPPALRLGVARPPRQRAPVAAAVRRRRRRRRRRLHLHAAPELLLQAPHHAKRSVG